MIEQIDTGLGTELSNTELAQQMGLSNGHFIRLFKQRFGLSPKAYRTRARLRQAVLMLLRDGQAQADQGDRVRRGLRRSQDVVA